MFATMLDQCGTMDILVSNAGLQKDARLEEMTLKDWNTVIGINLTGQFLCAREAVKEFKRRGVRPEVSCAAGKITKLAPAPRMRVWQGPLFCPRSARAAAASWSQARARRINL